jgi:outer membrane protein insertion porin family
LEFFKSKYLYIFLIYFILFGFITSCSNTRFLGEGETLLINKNIKGNQKIPDSELQNFYRQKPNRTLPFTNFSHYAYFYQVGLRNYDREEIQRKRNQVEQEYNQRIEAEEKTRRKARLQRKKNRRITRKDKLLNEGNFWMRQGEPLAVFDESLSQETVRQMNAYLHNKGFFKNQVDFNTEVKNRKVTVNYLINEGAPYIIDSINYQTGDTAITKLLQQNWSTRKLVEGTIYDQANLSAERERIDDLLKNNGYYDFSRQYIEFVVDTATIGNRRVLIDLIINKPAKRGYHKVYQIDSVIFTTDVSFNQVRTGRRKTSHYNGITYKYFDDDYAEQVLDKKLFIYPNTPYSKANTFETMRQLSFLDMFGNININYDTTGGKFIANIFTSPLKKYTTSNEVGLNVTQGFPGPFYNLSFKNRNPFRGMEILEINGRFGIEGVIGATGEDNAYQSQEAALNASLIFPQFISPWNDFLMKRLGTLNPRTRFLAGYNFTNRPEYIRSNFRNLLAYTWQDRRNNFFNVTPLEINLIYTTRISEPWQTRLDELQAQGIPLWRSFQPSFVSSMNFFTIFNFGKYGTHTQRAAFLRLFGESGGTTQNIIPFDFLPGNLETFRFFKISSDYRFHAPINTISRVAYRINGGIALPYGENRALPYEKYFFLGGSNSVRAWRPRRLGPGSYTPPIDAQTGFLRYDLEQPGEIMLEGSVEFRRNLIGFLNGAYFIDVGNVWTIREDVARPGANFALDRFWREIAVGSGLGLRFDFSFLIVRLDVGLKIYDPGRPDGQRFIGQMFPIGTELRNAVFNIGIGYPF